MIPVWGGEARTLATTYDEQPVIIGWLANDDAIFVREKFRTVERVSVLPINGERVLSWSPTDVMVTGATLNKSGAYIGFTSETPDEAPEAFISPASGFVLNKVSDVRVLRNLPIGKTDVLTWTSTDGLEVEGLLVYPVGYKAGEPVPMLVIVHGGPDGVFTRQFINNTIEGVYPIATFASQGFAVLRANPRGSSGYGREFRFANRNDFGGMDYSDIMTGVDTVIAMGVADSDRLGIMGWSYGGFMTSWVVTQTDRFRAASVGAAYTNLLSFMDTSDIPSVVPGYFPGESSEYSDTYVRHSPISHVKNVRTPTLIQHGEADTRVPVSLGYEFYNALKRLGVEVEMVVYPRQGHGFTDPKLQLDAMKRNVAWFKDRLMAKP